MNKELVIAAYDRNYDWISLVNKDIRITKYNKNVNIMDGETLITPNVGRDVHTFFYHIVKNYDSLSDYTFFSQDNPFDHVTNYVDIINGDVNIYRLHAKQDFVGCWFFCTQYPILTCDIFGNPHHPGLDIKSIWIQIFTDPIPDGIIFAPTGHFCVTKEHVHRYPKAFYEKIKTILENNPMAPWIFERLEPYIFGPLLNINI